MNTVITIGKRLIPIEHIAFIEPYDPATNAKLQTSKDYKARIVMINRDSALTEETPKAFAAAHGFRLLAGDHIATNPAIPFRVETFEPAEGFTPTKPFATRLMWRDSDGNDQSKLLVAVPEKVLAVVLRGEVDAQFEPPPKASALPDDSTARRTLRRRTAATPGEPHPPQ